MTKQIITTATDTQLAALREQFPQESGAQQIILPRLGMFSQDKTEGKGKAMKVITEAGTFFIDRETDEVNEEGKKVWAKTEIEDKTIDITVLFRRKQLRHYDEATEEYTSSPVYDNDDEVIPLFKNKSEIKRGTPAELKKDYQYVGKDGKVKNGLEENYILYVLYEGEMYQMNLRGTSMYAFKTFSRKTTPSTVITTIGNEAKENGSISWSQMSFTAKRPLSAEEADDVLSKIIEIKEIIAAQKAAFAKDGPVTVAGEVYTQVNTGVGSEGDDF